MMVRGTFANKRLKNAMVDGREADLEGHAVDGDDKLELCFACAERARDQSERHVNDREVDLRQELSPISRLYGLADRPAATRSSGRKKPPDGRQAERSRRIRTRPKWHAEKDGFKADPVGMPMLNDRRDPDA
ncbi:hypothetical protein [Bradyrhizobium sp. CCBAU 65884]|uniref:hypothetical protein n=1 Tax=Bradyrhizobium sp. CCBAU 65884 TaxID=722477 RepID=UPI002305D2B8|nr:hypothetical protein [Bradyrhizobium sp. CCBAU 65884]